MIPTAEDPLLVVELFAGIGAQRMALRNLGIPHRVVAMAEIDRHAVASYTAIHGETPNLGDVRGIEELPECDLVTYSFPCQDLSVAGLRRGMDEGSGTRSSCLWEVGRLIRMAAERERLPEALLMENVDAITNRRNMPSFQSWIQELYECGYTSSYDILDARDFGVPQRRRRCFMVSATGGRRFVFPEGERTGRTLMDILEGDVPESYYLSDEAIAKYEEHRRRHDAKGHGLGWRPVTPGDVGHPLTGNPSRHSQNFLVTDGVYGGGDRR